MTSQEIYNFLGNTASITGVTVLGAMGVPFWLGMWWRGHTISQKQRTRAFHDAWAILAETKLESALADGDTFTRGVSIPIQYRIKSGADVEVGAWLGASLLAEGKDGKRYSSPPEDHAIALRRGTYLYHRSLSVPLDVPPGIYGLHVNLWLGVPRGENESHLLGGFWPLKTVRIA